MAFNEGAQWVPEYSNDAGMTTAQRRFSRGTVCERHAGCLSGRRPYAYSVWPTDPERMKLAHTS